MTDIIIFIIIALILAGAIFYIKKEKKRGVRCVGCSDGGTCGGACKSGKEGKCNCSE